MNKENKYYVYGHYTVEGDKLFYIGKGQGPRLKQTGRSKAWEDFTKVNAWYAKILHDGLDNKTAIEIEERLIISMKQEGLLNDRLGTATRTIPVEVLSNFVYSEESPTGLVWAKDVQGKNKRWYHRIGDIAGHEVNTSDLKGKKYSITIGKDSWLVHRIIYSLFYPLCSSRVIDHIDGNPLNNKITNLREVTQQMNARNTNRTLKSNTGVTGVTRTKRKRLNFNQYIASWYSHEGKLCSKEFSSYKIGETEAFRLACEWRKEQLRLLNEQGAGYTDRHGT